MTDTRDNPFNAPRRDPQQGRRRGGTYGTRGRSNRRQQEARKAHAMMVVAACIYSLSAALFLAFGLFMLFEPQARTLGLILLTIGAVIGLGPVGTFARRKWALPPMYIMSVLSILSVPVGTIAALLVFFNAGKAKAIYR